MKHITMTATAMIASAIIKITSFRGVRGRCECLRRWPWGSESLIGFKNRFCREYHPAIPQGQAPSLANRAPTTPVQAARSARPSAPQSARKPAAQATPDGSSAASTVSDAGICVPHSWTHEAFWGGERHKIYTPPRHHRQVSPFGRDAPFADTVLRHRRVSIRQDSCEEFRPLSQDSPIAMTDRPGK